MNILIASTVSAYDNREEKALVQEINSIVKEMGHNVDFFYLPYNNDLYSIPQQMLSLRLLTIGLETDILLTVGYPAFALKHPKKYAFLFSLSSQFHEYWNSEYGVMEEFFTASRLLNIRNSVWHAEQIALREVKEVFCSTKMLQNIMQRDVDINSNLFSFSAPEKMKDDDINADNSYILVESNLTPPHRIELILDAVSKANTKFRLCLFLPQCETKYRKALDARIERLMISERVEIHEGIASISTIGKARAVVCAGYTLSKIPSYLYHSADYGIPVIILQDGGGLTELCDKYRGIIVAKADAIDLAYAMDKALKTSKDQVKSQNQDHSREIREILKRVVK